MAAKKRGYKRPTAKKFAEVAEKCHGTIGKIAECFGVSRLTIYRWMEDDPRLKEAIENYRGKLLDECLKSARIVALGIPTLDKDKKVIGWKEKPDSYMLRYLIGTLGKKEGFGESIDVTSKGESIKPEPLTVEIIDRREQVRQEEGEEQG